MRLLIITQKVDREDAVLGFFHRWIEVFGENCEHVTVICLERGVYHLPDNVAVFSLGKERMSKKHTMLSVRPSHSGGYRGIFARFLYTYRFVRYIVQFRHRYDVVFVHMNPEYVVLVGWLWRLWGKKIALWYNHAKGGLKVRFAAFFAQHIFYTSPHAFARRFKQARIMPAGIDTDVFFSSSDLKNYRDRNSRKASEHKFAASRQVWKILSLGRISPVKHIEVIVGALKKLDIKGINFVANIYGDPTDQDHAYHKKIQEIARPLEKKGKIVFHKSIPNYKAPVIYNAHEFFLNATPRGSLDKTILEAAASGVLPLVCNDSFNNILPPELFFKEGDSTDLARTMMHVFSLSEERKKEIQKQLREGVLQKHGLKTLVREIIAILT